MANNDHLNILKKGVTSWNQWRIDNPTIVPDLRQAPLFGEDVSGADFRKVDFSSANFRECKFDRTLFDGANLSGAKMARAQLSAASFVRTNLYGAELSNAIFSGADLSFASLKNSTLYEAEFVGSVLNGAEFNEAFLLKANFQKARLSNASFRESDARLTDFTDAVLECAIFVEANLYFAKFIRANLRGADLRFAQVVRTTFAAADLTGSFVHGISAWTVDLTNTKQDDLVITQPGDTPLTVDNLEVAQFIYLLINNTKLRDVIDTIGRKAVLILGRFTDHRLEVLEAIRDELRRRNYLPMLFTFDRPVSKDLTETITLLARMSRFIVADISEPSSIPQELQAIVPDVEIAVKPLIEAGLRPYAMFSDLRKYPWLMELHEYSDSASLVKSLESEVILPAEAKAEELTRNRTLRA
jgi:uncharacterized protein YjbI with pentapeptide repeats